MELNFFKKIGITIILVILLIFPLSTIKALIHEREKRANEACVEMATTWGGPQSIVGPIMTIPYINSYGIMEHARFLPESLEVDGELIPEIRYRGIFEMVVYKANLSIKGSFLRPDLSEWEIEDYQIMWDKAILTLGITELRGVQSVNSFMFNENQLEMLSGSIDYTPSNGLHAYLSPHHEEKEVFNQKSDGLEKKPISIILIKDIPFQIDILLQGSRQIYFAPVSKKNRIFLSSSWQHPSFKGSHLVV